MKVAHAILADLATADNTDGKLHVIGGGFRSLEFPGFPATMPRLALAVGLELLPEERGTPHQVRIEAHGPTAEEIAKPKDLSITVPVDQRVDYVNFVYNMENVAFPVAGEYGFGIYVDGKLAHDVELAVVASPGPVPASILAGQLLQMGYEAFARGDAAEASRIFKDVTRRFPLESGGYNNLGFVLLSQGETAAALDAFTKAGELGYPQSEIGDANVASALYLSGDAVAAFKTFETCVRTHIFRTAATLFGIGPSGLFPVQLNSAAEYGSLMALNAAWSALAVGDMTAAAHYLGSAKAGELAVRTDDDARRFLESVQALEAKSRSARHSG